MTIQLLGADALDPESKLFKIPIRIVTPSATTIALDMSASLPFDVISVDYQTGSGTLDLEFNIDAGSPIDIVWTGALTTLPTTTTALNKITDDVLKDSVAVGNSFNLVISNLASTPTFLSVDVLCRRT